jgi:molybdenum cofactor cytidylyltransferase
VSERERRVAAVVLAAGASTRLGRPKQLLEFRGETLVARAAAEARRAGADPIIVVLGAEAREIALALSGIQGITAIVNNRWASGLSSSLATGVREAVRLDGACDGVLITLSDQPLVDDTALRALLDAFEDGARVVAAEYGGTVGVPAVIGREHFGALLEITGDSGAGRWLRDRMDEVRRVPMPAAAMDIDRAEDSERLAALA